MTIGAVMRVDRGYLFWGVFLVLLGVIPLADREGWVDVGGLGDVGRLWPLVIIGIGVAILASRTRLAPVATIMAALVLGVLAGTGLAAVGGGVFECVRTGETQLQHTRLDGTLDPQASVRVRIDCGDLAVATAPGTIWTLDAGHAGGPPVVDGSAGELAITPADGPPRRQDWSLGVPGVLDTLDIDTNASSTSVDMGAATLRRLLASANAGSLRLVAPAGRLDGLRVDGNAADVHLRAPSADIGDLEVRGNATSLSLELGGSVTGTIDGTAMTVRVCVPPDADLRIETGDGAGFTHDLASSGLTRVGDAWVRAGDGPRVSLRVDGTLSTFMLDQTGACA